MMARKYAFEKGTKIQLVIDGKVWADTKMFDLLSTQFTCLVNDKTNFFFYADEGLTWRLKKD